MSLVLKPDCMGHLSDAFMFMKDQTLRRFHSQPPVPGRPTAAAH